MTERFEQIRRGVIALAYGEERYYPEPNDPTEAEQCLLDAIPLAKHNQCRFWDLIDRAEELATEGSK
jgi:hypothetical protein